MKVINEYLRTREELFDVLDVQPASINIQTRGPVKNVHFLKAGKGRPLILLHGGGSHSVEWAPLLPELKKYFELYLVDRPGCGQTDFFNYRGVDVRQHAVDFIRSFMDAVGLQQASFLVQSMGGYFALCFGLKFPERVEKLVFIGAPAGLNRWVPLPLRLMGTPGLNRLLINSVFRPSPKSVRGLYKNLFVHNVDKVRETFLEHVYYHQLLPGNTPSFFSLLANLLAFRGWRKHLLMTPELSRLEVPAGFIWGANDAFEKPETGKPKAQFIPQYQFSVVKEAGHCPWFDQPEQCAALVVEMLSGFAAARAGGEAPLAKPLQKSV